MRAKDISICAYVVAYHRPFSGARVSRKCYFMLHLQQVSVYRIWHQAPRRCISGEDAAADLMQAVSHYAWLPKDRNYSGFVRKAICYGAPLDTNKTMDFERFCHREGLLVEKYPDGSPASTWFAP